MIRFNGFYVRLILGTICLGQVSGLCAQQPEDRVQLRHHAVVTTSQIHLRDIALLRGPVVTRLGGSIVRQFSGSQNHLSLGLSQVQKHLELLGVNMARCTVVGAMSCQVQKQQKKAPQNVTSKNIIPPGAEWGLPPAASASPVLANVDQPLTTGTSITLSDHLKRYLLQWTGLSASELKVEYAPRDRTLLASVIGTDRLAFEPQGSEHLGKILILIERWRGTEHVGQMRLWVRLMRRTLGVVATHVIPRGRVLTPSDLEVRPVTLYSDRYPPLKKLTHALGQTARRAIKPGQVLYERDLVPTLLVERGQMVTVRCHVGQLVVRTLARAREDGHLNQIIELQNEKSRQRFSARVSGPQQAIVVRTPQHASPAFAQGGA